MFRRANHSLTKLLKKNTFPKFKLQNPRCGLPAGLYSNLPHVKLDLVELAATIFFSSV